MWVSGSKVAVNVRVLLFNLTLVSGQHLNMVLGGSVLLAVIGCLSPYRLNATPVSLFAAGFCSGVMGTAASIGGPSMALLLQNESGNRIRANLSMFFVVGSLISLVMLAFSGLMSLAQLGFGLLLLPAVLIGHKAATRWLSGSKKSGFAKSCWCCAASPV